MSGLDEMIPAVTVPEGSSGAWSVRRFSVTEDQARLENLRASFGRGRFIRSGTYTRLTRGGAVIMSDTPAEKRDHVDIVRHACGHVLINGLGLGMVLQAVLRKPGVRTVTVVEQSAEVIALCAETYAADPRVTIIHADAYDWKPPAGVRYGAVWHDIWDDICSDNLPGMIRLHRKYGRRTDWQGSWARELCEMQRSGRR